MTYYNRVVLYFDGASKNNPRGPAGCGFCLYEMDVYGADTQFITSGNSYLGYNVSNNQAEYQGLIDGLSYILHNISCNRVYVRGDSEIVIRQMLGEYNVNSPNIRPYYNDAKSVLEDIEREVDFCDFRHISRQKNWEADQLANEAINDYY